MTRYQSQYRYQRRGFTMIELLVVIGLILFLMSISIAALSSAIGIARQRATQSTILKVHGLIQQRVEAFQRAMERTNLQPNINKVVRDLGIRTRRTQDDKVYQILARKQIFQIRFPQNFSEHSLAGTASYNAAKHNADTESAALLYWLLTSSEVFGVAPVDESEFTSSEVRDTDGDNLLEFVDGWGRPLRFYRWPTHLFRPGNATTPPGVAGSADPNILTPIDRTYVSALWSGLPPAPIDAGEMDQLARDPDDPTGQLRRYLKNSLVANQEMVMTTFQNRFHTPGTFHAFLIMSAGPDGILGLGEPWTPLPDSAPSGTPALISSSPNLDTLFGQGRLAALTQYGPIEDHPLNDNLTNRKR